MSQNMCRRQLKCRSLGFACSEAEKESFYVSQWGNNKAYFLVYRVLIGMYSLGWTLAYLIDLGINHNDRFKISYTFLTNWGDVINTIYFVLAACLAIVGVVNRTKMIFTDNVPTKILRSVVWMFYSFACTAQILIFSTYWATLAPKADPEDIPTPFNIHRHGINMFLVLLDVWVAAFPIRLLHFVYPVIVAALYILMTIIEHATGGISDIYPFLNWATNPGLAAGVAVALAMFGPLICQSLFFGLYNLRLLIADRCCDREISKHDISPTHHHDIDNPAFNDFE